MKDIAIYGAGGLGRDIYCLIQRINQKIPTWNVIGFFDDGKEIGIKVQYGTILGGLNELNTWSSPLDVVLSIGSPNNLMKITSKIANPNISFPNIIAPDTIWLDNDSSHIGKGNVICCGCLFSCNVTIGDFNLFNGFITIGHDVSIGNCNTFMPAVRISGEVDIENNNFFGASSVILQQLKIGNRVQLSAGSCLYRNTKDDTLYMGNPATMKLIPKMQ